MKYTTEQLELIAIMFKIQHGEKTVGDIFPCCRDDQLKDVKIRELVISTQTQGGFYVVDFMYNRKLIMWIYCIEQLLCPVSDVATIEADIPIDDIIKMLSFEDKI